LFLPSQLFNYQVSGFLNMVHAWCFYAIDPTQVGAPVQAEQVNALERDGRNTAAILERIAREKPDEMARICEFLRAAVPQVRSVRPRREASYTTIEYDQLMADGTETTLPGSTLSGGTLRLLGLLTAVCQPQVPTLLTMEEPEDSVHPGALGVMLDVIQAAAARSQVIVTSHSPELLEAKWIQPEHVRLVEWRDGSTQVGLMAKHCQEVLRDRLGGVGYQLSSNYLEAEPADSAPPLTADDLFDARA
jgi:predicted ATPase